MKPQTIEPGARVVIASRNDEEAIMALCREMHDEIGQMPLCENKVRELLNEAFDEHGGIIGVIRNESEIEGAIFLRIGQPWYSSDWVLEEFLCFVLPQYRRSSNAADLIEFAKRCARGLGLKLFMGITTTERTEAKIRLYERKLSRVAGALFIYDGAAAAQVE